MTQKEINPYDYSYNQEATWTIPAQAGLMIIDYMNQVIASQPTTGALMLYPKSSEEIKDAQGKVVDVNIQWEEHTMESFFATASQENGAIPFMTSISFKAEQIKQSLTLFHLENIKNGTAKKITDLKEQDALSKL